MDADADKGMELHLSVPVQQGAWTSKQGGRAFSLFFCLYHEEEKLVSRADRTGAKQKAWSIWKHLSTPRVYNCQLTVSPSASSFLP